MPKQVLPPYRHDVQGRGVRAPVDRDGVGEGEIDGVGEAVDGCTRSTYGMHDDVVEGSVALKIIFPLADIPDTMAPLMRYAQLLRG